MQNLISGSLKLCTSKSLNLFSLLNYFKIVLCFYSTKYFFQIPHHIDLQPLSSHDTGLNVWGKTRFTVLESGIIVFWGKTSEQTPAAFHLYQNTSTGFIKLREVKRLCQHEIVLLLPAAMDNKESISCQLWVLSDDQIVGHRDRRSNCRLLSSTVSSFGNES